MKIKGSKLTGLFQFISGVSYTKNDIILYNNRFYIVVGNEFDGKLTPDKSKDCMNYIEYNSFSSGTGSPLSLVTSKSVLGVIKKYFKGLTGDGEIDSIEINSISDLNKYVDTGAYKCTIRKEFIGLIPPGEYLLRIYKAKTVTIQEFIDYSTGLFVVRNVNEGNVFILPSSDPENQDRIVSTIQNIDNRIKEILEISDKLNKSTFNFQNVPFIKSGEKKYIIRETEVYQIMHLIFLDTRGDEYIQYSKEIYLTNLSKDVKIYFDELNYLTATFDGLELRIVVTDSNIQLVKSYISRGNS